MGSGVDHSIGSEPMREIGVGAGVAECKLQHCHAGNFMTLAQLDHVRGDQPQVFGEKWQAAKLLAKLVEKFVARSVHPLTFDCRGLVGGDFPELGESAKVIQADKVAGLSGPA